MKCITDLEFGTFTLLTKLIPGDNCHAWSPTIPRMVTPQPKDGHPPEESVLQTWNLALRLNTQNGHQVSTAITYHSYDGHPPTKGWSTTKRKCTADMEFGTWT